MPRRIPSAEPGSIHYRQLFEANPIPMWVYDLETLAFLEVNDAAVEKYGYSREEFLDLTIADIRPAEDVPALLDNVRRVGEGLDLAGVWRHYRKDGTVLAVEITSHVVDWCGRRAEMVMALDVTERQRAAASLRASERRFLQTFRTSPALMSLARFSDRVLIDVSDSFARLAGYGREEMIGRTSLDLGLWADPDEARRLQEVLVTRRCLLDQEIRVRTRGGEIRSVIAAFSVIDLGDEEGVLGTAIDVTERRAAEALVARQKAQLEHLLASSPTTLYTLSVDGKSLVPTFVTDNVERVLGYSPTEVTTSTFFAENVHPDDREAAVRAGAILRASGQAALEYRFRHRDGSYRWLRDEMRVTRRDEGRPVEVTGSWSDVTEVRRTGEALRESEEKFRLAFENAPIGMAIVGLDERFLQVNQALCRILGRGSQQLLALTVPEVTHPEDRGAERTAKERLHSDGTRTFSMEKRYLRPDGGPVLGRLSVSAVPDRSGQPMYFIGQLEDITEKALAERALRESERRFRALIENAADAVALLAPDGTIRYTSPATVRVLGYDADELVGRKAYELIHPDETDVVADAIAGCTGSPGSLVQTQARARSKGGNWRLLEGRFFNRLEDPSVGAIVVNYRDITDEKQLEERLAQAQRLDSIGRLAGGIAHDFNNLLTAILGYTELLETQPADAGKLDALGEIRRAGERARELTQQLLTFARRQMISPRTLNLNDLVRSAGRLIDRLTGELIVVRTSLAESLWDIEADAVQLEQVLLNLAINARDAMPEGGTLTIATEAVELTADYAAAHPQVAPGPHVRLVVSDTGTGIPAETLGSIFEPFFTTKPVGQGTGLGLATVYGIVRRAGGDISVRSEVGRGTTFEIVFPKSSRARPEDDGTSARAVRGGAETILVVEDDERVRTLAARVLRGAGYTVLSAENGPEALALVADSDTTIDLLVTDVVMPGMSGKDVADALTSRSPLTRVLYASGYTQDTIGHHGVLDPGVSFLAKPFTPSALLAKVREVLER